MVIEKDQIVDRVHSEISRGGVGKIYEPQKFESLMTYLYVAKK